MQKRVKGIGAAKTMVQIAGVAGDIFGEMGFDFNLLVISHL